MSFLRRYADWFLPSLPVLVAFIVTTIVVGVELLWEMALAALAIVAIIATIALIAYLAHLGQKVSNAEKKRRNEAELEERLRKAELELRHERGY